MVRYMIEYNESKINELVYNLATNDGDAEISSTFNGKKYKVNADFSKKLEAFRGKASDNNFKRNSENILSGGINPELSLLSKIFGDEVTYESDFLGSDVHGNPLRVSDFVTLRNVNNKQAQYMEKGAVRIRKKPNFDIDKASISETIGNKPFQQLAKFGSMNNQNLSSQVFYKEFDNFSYTKPYTINLFENRAYSGLLDEDLESERIEDLKQYLNPNSGEFHKKLLFGCDQMKGLFNNPGIIELTSQEVQELGLGNGDGLYADFNRMYTDNPKQFSNFVKKLTLIAKGTMPSEFTSLSSFRSMTGMKDPVFIVAKTLYDGASFMVDTQLGGTMQFQKSANEAMKLMLNSAGCNIEMLSLPQADYNFNSQTGQWSLVSGKQYFCMLYDRAKVYKYETLAPIEMFSPVSINAGTTVNGFFVGATTDVINFDSFVGIKFKINLP